MMVGLVVRLLAGWGCVAAFLAVGATLLALLATPPGTAMLFALLLGIIVWMAFGVVHEAEALAVMLGEPYGTLILTLSIVVIEVTLIAAVMLGGADASTLGRDTMFAVLMIVLNGVVGLGLLLGGLRHHEQSYNLQGASAYLAVILPLTTIALVLPNFTTSTADGSLTSGQAVVFSVLTVALYGIFLALQTGRHRGYFQDADLVETRPGPPVPVAPSATVLRHVALLLAHILPIIILSKSLATVLDHGIIVLGAPPALGGVLIAMVVFMPEGLSALRAIAANQLTRAVNLCLGAATSTLGLTVPAVLVIGLVTGRTVTLGLSQANMVLLVTTLILSALTFSGPRTTMLEGAVHLVLFCVFFVLIFSP